MKQKWLAAFAAVVLLASTTLSVSAEEIIRTDVAVIGAGAAGLAASIEAANAGANVVLLEKMPIVGGSTLLSGGIVYATNSPIQKKLGIEDSVDALVKYWLERAEGHADEKLLRLVAERSGETIAWLIDKGVEFQNLTPAGTSPVPRAHWATNHGFGLVKPLENAAKAKGVRMLLETTAEKLLTDDKGAVIGVLARDKKGNVVKVYAGAVVLATGGFDVSKEMKKEYAPVATNHISYSGRGNVGDGLRMAKEVGADIVFNNGVIGFRGVSEDLPYTTPVGGLVFTPALYVDQKGNRFVNEATDYPIIYTAMVKNGSSMFYLIMDSEYYTDAFDKGVEKGVMFKANTVEELAAAAGLDKAVFVKTIARYNELAKKGKDEDFEKDPKALAAIDKAPYYALQVQPATLGSFGGPRIDLEARVLSKTGKPIPGLFAAGEVVNGQFFYKEYPASGTSIQMSLTLGRIAGKNAAVLAKGAKVTHAYKDGVYTGKADGLHGEIVVEVEIREGKIVRVTLVSQHETPGITDVALERIPAEIVNTNSPDVDVVTGATVTSKGIISAVKNALSKAK